MEALKSSPNLRGISGFEKIMDILSESDFSGAFAEFPENRLGQGM
jgi:hypothetical protein